MAIELTPEQRALGKGNFERTVGAHQLTRRDFMKGLAAAGAALPISAAAFYGYRKLAGNPVRVGLIGTGDEGGVLVGEHNPDYLQIVAVSDIRPTNKRRIFDGEAGPPRLGLKRIYGSNAERDIPVYDDYKELLARADIEAVLIALPLHLHAAASIDAMRAGKHVLCEKLMAWNVKQCKEMIHVAEETDRVLAIGHQRHYSLLYAYALELLQAGELGDVHHIRAFWHRHNAMPVLDERGTPKMEPGFDAKTGQFLPGVSWPLYRDSWRPAIHPDDRTALANKIQTLGYRSIEELVRWRLYHRTGGGLMAELGSHQLDACSIFLGKERPLAVSGVGGKYLYRDDRDVEDHVYCTFEFPGKNYWEDPSRTRVKDRNDVVVVTYSSINSNRFEPYGECVMGTKGTLILEQEKDVLLYPTAGRSTAMAVSSASQPVMDASATYPASAAPDPRQAEQAGKAAVSSAAASRGYREEMEHFAFCVRMWQDASLRKNERPRPRCDGYVAMADAIVALTSNLAMRGTQANGHKPQRIVFQPEWFNPHHGAVPEEG